MIFGQLNLPDCGSVTGPEAPRGLTATADSQTRIDLSWTAPSGDGGADITGYRIEVSTNGSSWSDLVANTRSTSASYSHTGLTAGTTRHYRVSAINSAGTGPASNVDDAITDPAIGAQSGTTACVTGGAVPDAANNPGLVSDCEALLAGKDTLVGTGTLNWSADVPMVNWDGVSVGNSPTRVLRLTLEAYRLNGEIPPELGRLSNLTYLYLQVNQLTGGIPPELGGLSNLTDLRLRSNQLTGGIPPELGGLSNLTELVLYSNQLTGEIPPELGGLSKLKGLWLYGNQLTGEIPPELGRLSNLTDLLLRSNQLTGGIPTKLGGLSKLWVLDLQNNRLTGEIPSDLSGLSNLTDLLLDSNQLTGGIPPELGRLSNLRQLSLNRNQLTGEIPPELGRLSKLTWLGLSDNQLTGCIPEGLRDIADNDLGQLNLPDCGAATPDGDRAALIALYNATGGPNWARNNNWLSDVPISEWSGVTTDDNGRVFSLYLYSNQLTGEIPSELGGLSNLTGLWLGLNQLTGEIPPELGGLSNLTHLSLGLNQLTGEIPSELGGLSNLTHLSLGSNQLTGEIPPELGGLSKLTQMVLDHNQLTGEIPSELGGLSNLTHLYLPGNNLTGEIPPELGGLSNLTQLVLDHNQLTGEIPPELDGLSKLTRLFLRGNQLTGCIPEGLRDIAENDLGQLNLPDCGAATPGVTPTPTPTPTPASEGADGVCHVGLIVSPGESCTYPGTSTEFTVDSSGTGRFLFFTAGTGIDARNTTINGVTYNFKASKQDDGNWIIEAAGDS